MHTLLHHLSRLVSRHPGRVLLALAAITVALGVVSSDQATDTELTSFAPDSDLAAALDRVQGDFGANGATLQVVVDAGADGDALAADGLAAGFAVEAAIEAAVTTIDTAATTDTSSAAGDAPSANGTIQVVSFATVLAERLTAEGVEPAEATPDQRARAMAGAQSDGAALALSTDADPTAGGARAGLVVVNFPSSMDEGAVATASLAIAERVDGLDTGDIAVSPFNWAILNDALEAESEREMSRLLGLSLLLILGILLFQYRTISDVAIGLVGLIATITWMLGIAVLLGPGYLGLVGPFTQIAMIVPVLLVGLGIDYAIHLTARYREEQSHDQEPKAAASMAVRTVGGALALATATTIVGFLTNLASPLPPIADFGIFTATGVVAAFVIMSLGVPAARSLLDARRLRRRPDAPARVHRPAGGLGAVIGRTSVASERAPRLTLAVALVVTLGAVAAATQVGTTFSQDDFVPADSEVGMLIDRIDTLFAGDITETTYVLLDGDLNRPEVATAMLAAQDRLAAVPAVRLADGAAQVSSPTGLIASAAAADPEVARQAAALGFELGGGFAPDADVAGLYELARTVAPAAAARLIDDAGTAGVLVIATSAGQDGARVLADAVEGAVAPLVDAGVTATVTSEPIVLEESLDALTASQTQGIVITLVAALLLLMGYYGIKERTPTLGIITMVPSVAVVSWVLATMWLLDISFNVLTAMVASLGIGIGVPFGIHVTHRFLEDRRRYDTIDEAIKMTVTHTGGAMAGSAVTTAAGFGVLVFASLVPMQQFGTIVAITILYSFAAAVLIQPACLKLWAERRARRGEQVTLGDHERRPSESVLVVEGPTRHDELAEGGSGDGDLTDARAAHRSGDVGSSDRGSSADETDAPTTPAPAPVGRVDERVPTSS